MEPPLTTTAPSAGRVTEFPTALVTSLFTEPPTFRPSPRSPVVDTSDFFIEYSVLTNDSPTDEQVNSLLVFTNEYVNNFLKMNVTEYVVESFDSSLYDLVVTPASIDPPTTTTPATIRLVFKTTVIIAEESPFIPTASDIDFDIARAFETDTTFLDFLVSVVQEFPDTPFSKTIRAQWSVIDLGG
jgi:hypothetical protein